MRAAHSPLSLPSLSTFASLLLLSACSPGASPGALPSSGAGHSASGSAGTPLILREDEGERRVRRSAPSGLGVVGVPLIIKVDRRNGGSPDFMMGYEHIPPGRGIPRHYHPRVDEILFIHRGTGRATLGDREVMVAEGTTIYIPPNTRVSLQNTGAEPLSLVFLFPDPDMAEYFRGQSVPEGEPAPPFTAEEFAAFRASQRAHIVFEPR